jgi:hypothetical protein
MYHEVGKHLLCAHGADSEGYDGSTRKDVHSLLRQETGECGVR